MELTFQCLGWQMRSIKKYSSSWISLCVSRLCVSQTKSSWSYLRALPVPLFFSPVETDPPTSSVLGPDAPSFTPERPHLLPGCSCLNLKGSWIQRPNLGIDFMLQMYLSSCLLTLPPGYLAWSPFGPQNILHWVFTLPPLCSFSRIPRLRVVPSIPKCARWTPSLYLICPPTSPVPETYLLSWFLPLPLPPTTASSHHFRGPPQPPHPPCPSTTFKHSAWHTRVIHLGCAAGMCACLNKGIHMPSLSASSWNPHSNSENGR